MALPFVAGLAIGAGIIVAYNKIGNLKDALGFGVDKTKELAACGIEKTKDVAADIKETVGATVECIKEKKTARKSAKSADVEIEKEEE
ncbi:MAG: hypothetical protein HRT43_08040 [Campylobacteraceae bacterium]|nr:hypothetical protein [Campylobacteraceae bacterium]